jgi:hypothetical protein
VWLTIGWTALELVRGVESARARRAVGAVGAVLVGVTLAYTVVTSVRAFDGPPALGEQRAYDRLVPQLRRIGPTLPEPVVVADRGGLSSAGLGSSVLNGLLAAGVDARYSRAFAWQVGGTHVVDRAHARTHLLVVYGDDSERLRTDPRYRVVAAADELNPAERAELEHLQGSFRGFEGQIRWTREHPVLAQRLQALTRRSARAVVLVERG